MGISENGRKFKGAIIGIFYRVESRRTRKIFWFSVRKQIATVWTKVRKLSPVH